MYRFLVTCLFSLLLIGNVNAQKSRDHVSAGVGLGMIYADNAGIYKYMQFKTLPAFSVAYSRDFQQS